jgi:hypothetical protein
MIAKRRQREARLDPVEVARRRSAAKARQAADRAANPAKYAAMEAKRYRRHEAGKSVREVARRPAFGRLSEEIRAERMHFAVWSGDLLALDRRDQAEGISSVWDCMLSLMHWKLQPPKDDRVGDAAYHWLKMFHVEHSVDMYNTV